MKKIFLQPKFATLLLGCFLCINSFAQLDPNTSSTGSGSDPLNPDAPIDGGISLLIAAGAAAGARKLYKNKKEKNEESI